MIVLLLVMFLCCLSSSALYGFGFVPGTLRYVKRTFDLGVYDRVGGDVYSVCDDIMKHEPLREKYDNEDTTYFSFGGSKKIMEVIDKEKYKEFLEKRSVCRKIKDGKVIKKDAMVEQLKDLGLTGDKTITSEECDENKKYIYPLEGIEKAYDPSDKKLYAQIEIIEQMYPKLYKSFTETCSSV